MIKSKTIRKALKKVYKKARTRDGAEIGRKINDLTQALHLQFRLSEKDRDVNLMAQCIDGIAEAKKEHRFRDEFPSFAKFYEYVTSEKAGFVPEDVKEL